MITYAADLAPATDTHGPRRAGARTRSICEVPLSGDFHHVGLVIDRLFDLVQKKVTYDV